jgi:hypothetical protein
LIDLTGNTAWQVRAEFFFEPSQLLLTESQQIIVSVMATPYSDTARFSEGSEPNFVFFHYFLPNFNLKKTPTTGT